MTETGTLNVLLVDDSRVARSKLAELCERIPFVRVVAQASDGAGAIRKAKQEQPDLVLMDLVMPNIDGIVALRMLCGGVPGIRVAVVSSLGGSKRVAQEAFRLGAIEVLSKPVRAEDVARLCEIERAHKQRTTPNQAPPNHAPPTQASSIKSFGQFLVERQAITLPQLRAAIELVEASATPLDDLAVELALLTPGQAERVRTEAVESGYSIKELIEQDGLLDAKSLNHLSATQESRQLDIGAALVELGHLAENAHRDLLERYENEQESARAISNPLPGGLAGHRPAQVLLELVPGYLKEITGRPAQVSYVQVVEVPEQGTLRVSLLVRGSTPMRVELIANHEFAASIARGLSEARQDASDQRVLMDGLLEFLNVVIGNALTLLESEGLHLSIAPPGPAVAGGSGTTLEILTASGRAWIGVDADPEMPERYSQLDLQIEEPQ